MLLTDKKKYSLLLPPGQVGGSGAVRILEVGSRGDDVKELQTFLREEGSYPNGRVTGYFGPLTKKAVQRFQNKYRAEILTPNGFKSATGMVGSATRKKINDLLGSQNS